MRILGLMLLIAGCDPGPGFTDVRACVRPQSGDEIGGDRPVEVAVDASVLLATCDEAELSCFAQMRGRDVVDVSWSGSIDRCGETAEGGTRGVATTCALEPLPAGAYTLRFEDEEATFDVPGPEACVELPDDTDPPAE